MAEQNADNPNHTGKAPAESGAPDGGQDDLGFTQDDIDALLDAAKSEAGDEPAPATAGADSEAVADAAAVSSEASPDASAVAQAESGGASPVGAAESVTSPPAVEPGQLEVPSFDEAQVASAASQSINLLKDVQLHVKVELGRTYMFVEDVLRLGEGSVVELDKLAGDPVDVYVNDRLVARGEVLVLNDNFCVRVSEIIAARDARMAG